MPQEPSLLTRVFLFIVALVAAWTPIVLFADVLMD